MMQKLLKNIATILSIIPKFTIQGTHTRYSAYPAGYAPYRYSLPAS